MTATPVRPGRVRDHARNSAAQPVAQSRNVRAGALEGGFVPEVADKSVREMFVKSYRLIYAVRQGRVARLFGQHWQKPNWVTRQKARWLQSGLGELLFR